MFKRILAFFLAFLMVFCFMPTYAQDDVATPTNIAVTEYVEIDDDDFGEIGPEFIHREVYIDIAEQSATYGEPITLIAILVNFQPDDNPVFTWQYSHDKENWIEIVNEKEKTYTFIVTQENANYWYRVLVTI